MMQCAASGTVPPMEKLAGDHRHLSPAEDHPVTTVDVPQAPQFKVILKWIELQR